MLLLISVDNLSIFWAQIHKEGFLDSYINPSDAIHLKSKNPKTTVWFIESHPHSTMSHHIELFEMASNEVVKHKQAQCGDSSHRNRLDWSPAVKELGLSAPSLQKSSSAIMQCLT